MLRTFTQVGSAEYVKRMAKRLRPLAGPDVTWSCALEAMARAVGFRDWHECHTVLNAAPANPPPREDFPPDVRDRMLERGAEHLVQYLSEHVDALSFGVTEAKAFLDVVWKPRADAAPPDLPPAPPPTTSRSPAERVTPQDLGAPGSGQATTIVTYRRKRPYVPPNAED